MTSVHPWRRRAAPPPRAALRAWRVVLLDAAGRVLAQVLISTTCAAIAVVRVVDGQRWERARPRRADVYGAKGGGHRVACHFSIDGAGRVTPLRF